ncbi:hypothetical protein GGF31_000408 [Allomyces arbusculus]|nr:hypothetical protein GGF31_000408 [Allomyces arbusculus]
MPPKRRGTAPVTRRKSARLAVTNGDHGGGREADAIRALDGNHSDTQRHYVETNSDVTRAGPGPGNVPAETASVPTTLARLPPSTATSALDADRIVRMDVGADHGASTAVILPTHPAPALPQPAPEPDAHASLGDLTLADGNLCTILFVAAYCDFLRHPDRPLYRQTYPLPLPDHVVADLAEALVDMLSAKPNQPDRAVRLLAPSKWTTDASVAVPRAVDAMIRSKKLVRIHLLDMAVSPTTSKAKRTRRALPNPEQSSAVVDAIKRYLTTWVPVLVSAGGGLPFAEVAASARKFQMGVTAIPCILDAVEMGEDGDGTRHVQWTVARPEAAAAARFLCPGLSGEMPAAATAAAATANDEVAAEVATPNGGFAVGAAALNGEITAEATTTDGDNTVAATLKDGVAADMANSNDDIAAAEHLGADSSLGRDSAPAAAPTNASPRASSPTGRDSGDPEVVAALPHSHTLEPRRPQVAAAVPTTLDVHVQQPSWSLPPPPQSDVPAPVQPQDAALTEIVTPNPVEEPVPAPPQPVVAPVVPVKSSLPEAPVPTLPQTTADSAVPTASPLPDVPSLLQPQAAAAPVMLDPPPALRTSEAAAAQTPPPLPPVADLLATLTPADGNLCVALFVAVHADRRRNPGRPIYQRTFPVPLAPSDLHDLVEVLGDLLGSGLDRRLRSFAGSDTARAVQTQLRVRKTVRVALVEHVPGSAALPISARKKLAEQDPHRAPAVVAKIREYVTTWAPAMLAAPAQGLPFLISDTVGVIKYPITAIPCAFDLGEDDAEGRRVVRWHARTRDAVRAAEFLYPGYADELGAVEAGEEAAQEEQRQDVEMGEGHGQDVGVVDGQQQQDAHVPQDQQEAMDVDPPEAPNVVAHQDPNPCQTRAQLTPAPGPAVPPANAPNPTAMLTPTLTPIQQNVLATMFPADGNLCILLFIAAYMDLAAGTDQPFHATTFPLPLSDTDITVLTMALTRALTAGAGLDRPVRAFPDAPVAAGPSAHKLARTILAEIIAPHEMAVGAMRLQDADVRASPALATLVRKYLTEWVPAALGLGGIPVAGGAMVPLALETVVGTDGRRAVRWVADTPQAAQAANWLYPGLSEEVVMLRRAAEEAAEPARVQQMAAAVPDDAPSPQSRGTDTNGGAPTTAIDGDVLAELSTIANRNLCMALFAAAYTDHRAHPTRAIYHSDFPLPLSPTHQAQIVDHLVSTLGDHLSLRLPFLIESKSTTTQVVIDRRRTIRLVLSDLGTSGTRGRALLSKTPHMHPSVRQAVERYVTAWIPAVTEFPVLADAVGGVAAVPPALEVCESEDGARVLRWTGATQRAAVAASGLFAEKGRKPRGLAHPTADVEPSTPFPPPLASRSSKGTDGADAGPGFEAEDAVHDRNELMREVDARRAVPDQDGRMHDREDAQRDQDEPMREVDAVPVEFDADRAQNDANRAEADANRSDDDAHRDHETVVRAPANASPSHTDAAHVETGALASSVDAAAAAASIDPATEYSSVRMRNACIALFSAVYDDQRTNPTRAIYQTTYPLPLIDHHRAQLVDHLATLLGARLNQRLAFFVESKTTVAIDRRRTIRLVLAELIVGKCFTTGSRPSLSKVPHRHLLVTQYLERYLTAWIPAVVGKAGFPVPAGLLPVDAIPGVLDVDVGEDGQQVMRWANLPERGAAAASALLAETAKQSRDSSRTPQRSRESSSAAERADAQASAPHTPTEPPQPAAALPGLGTALRTSAPHENPVVEEDHHLTVGPTAGDVDEAHGQDNAVRGQEDAVNRQNGAVRDQDNAVEGQDDEIRSLVNALHGCVDAVGDRDDAVGDQDMAEDYEPGEICDYIDSARDNVGVVGERVDAVHGREEPIDGQEKAEAEKPGEIRDQVDPVHDEVGVMGEHADPVHDRHEANGDKDTAEADEPSEIRGHTSPARAQISAGRKQDDVVHDPETPVHDQCDAAQHPAEAAHDQVGEFAGQEDTVNQEATVRPAIEFTWTANCNLCIALFAAAYDDQCANPTRSIYQAEYSFPLSEADTTLLVDHFSFILGARLSARLSAFTSPTTLNWRRTIRVVLADLIAETVASPASIPTLGKSPHQHPAVLHAIKQYLTAWIPAIAGQAEFAIQPGVATVNAIPGVLEVQDRDDGHRVLQWKNLPAQCSDAARAFLRSTVRRSKDSSRTPQRPVSLPSRPYQPEGSSPASAVPAVEIHADVAHGLADAAHDRDDAIVGQDAAGRDESDGAAHDHGGPARDVQATRIVREHADDEDRRQDPVVYDTAALDQDGVARDQDRTNGGASGTAHSGSAASEALAIGNYNVCIALFAAAYDDQSTNPTNAIYQTEFPQPLTDEHRALLVQHFTSILGDRLNMRMTAFTSTGAISKKRTIRAVLTELYTDASLGRGAFQALGKSPHTHPAVQQQLNRYITAWIPAAVGSPGFPIQTNELTVAAIPSVLEVHDCDDGQHILRWVNVFERCGATANVFFANTVKRSRRSSLMPQQVDVQPGAPQQTDLPPSTPRPSESPEPAVRTDPGTSGPNDDHNTVEQSVNDVHMVHDVGATRGMAYVTEGHIDATHRQVVETEAHVDAGQMPVDSVDDEVNVDLATELTTTSNCNVCIALFAAAYDDQRNNPARPIYQSEYSLPLTDSDTAQLVDHFMTILGEKADLPLAAFTTEATTHRRRTIRVILAELARGGVTRGAFQHLSKTAQLHRIVRQAIERYLTTWIPAVKDLPGFPIQAGIMPVDVIPNVLECGVRDDGQQVLRWVSLPDRCGATASAVICALAKQSPDSRTTALAQSTYDASAQRFPTQRPPTAPSSRPSSSDAHDDNLVRNAAKAVGDENPTATEPDPVPLNGNPAPVSFASGNGIAVDARPALDQDSDANLSSLDDAFEDNKTNGVKDEPLTPELMPIDKDNLCIALFAATHDDQRMNPTRVIYQDEYPLPLSDQHLALLADHLALVLGDRLNIQLAFFVKSKTDGSIDRRRTIRMVLMQLIAGPRARVVRKTTHGAAPHLNPAVRQQIERYLTTWIPAIEVSPGFPIQTVAFPVAAIPGVLERYDRDDGNSVLRWVNLPDRCSTAAEAFSCDMGTQRSQAVLPCAKPSAPLPGEVSPPYQVENGPAELDFALASTRDSLLASDWALGNFGMLVWSAVADDRRRDSTRAIYGKSFAPTANKGLNQKQRDELVAHIVQCCEAAHAQVVWQVPPPGSEQQILVAMTVPDALLLLVNPVRKMGPPRSARLHTFATEYLAAVLGPRSASAWITPSGRAIPRILAHDPATLGGPLAWSAQLASSTVSFWAPEGTAPVELKQVQLLRPKAARSASTPRASTSTSAAASLSTVHGTRPTRQVTTDSVAAPGFTATKQLPAAGFTATVLPPAELTALGNSCYARLCELVAQLEEHMLVTLRLPANRDNTDAIMTAWESHVKRVAHAETHTVDAASLSLAPSADVTVHDVARFLAAFLASQLATKFLDDFWPFAGVDFESICDTVHDVIQSIYELAENPHDELVYVSDLYDNRAPWAQVMHAALDATWDLLRTLHVHRAPGLAVDVVRDAMLEFVMVLATLARVGIRVDFPALGCIFDEKSMVKFRSPLFVTTPSCDQGEQLFVVAAVAPWLTHDGEHVVPRGAEVVCWRSRRFDDAERVWAAQLGGSEGWTLPAAVPEMMDFDQWLFTDPVETPSSLKAPDFVRSPKLPLTLPTPPHRPTGLDAPANFVGARGDVGNAARTRKRSRSATPVRTTGEVCVDCGESEAYQWREDPTSGNWACNACRLRRLRAARFVPSAPRSRNAPSPMPRASSGSHRRRDDAYGADSSRGAPEYALRLGEDGLDGLSKRRRTCSPVPPPPPPPRSSSQTSRQLRPSPTGRPCVGCQVAASKLLYEEDRYCASCGNKRIHERRHSLLLDGRGRSRTGTSPSRSSVPHRRDRARDEAHPSGSNGAGAACDRRRVSEHRLADACSPKRRRTSTLRCACGVTGAADDATWFRDAAGNPACRACHDRTRARPLVATMLYTVPMTPQPSPASVSVTATSILLPGTPSQTQPGSVTWPISATATPADSNAGAGRGGGSAGASAGLSPSMLAHSLIARMFANGMRTLARALSGRDAPGNPEPPNPEA